MNNSPSAMERGNYPRYLMYRKSWLLKYFGIKIYVTPDMNTSGGPGINLTYKLTYVDTGNCQRTDPGDVACIADLPLHLQRLS